MARIRLDDLPPEETLSPEELERLFGAGVRDSFRPTFEGLENRELYAAGVTAAAVTSGALIGAATTGSTVQIDYSSQLATPTVNTWSAVGNFKQVVVGNNANGSAVAFALSADGNTTYINTTLTNGTWDPRGWSILTSMKNPVTISGLAVTAGDDGQAEPFGLGTDYRVYELTSTADDPGYYSWTAVAHGVPDGGAASLVAYTNPQTNLQSLYAVSENHRFVYRLTQTIPGDWSGNWKQIDAAWNQPQEVQGIRVVIQDRQPLVFAITRAQPNETVNDTVKLFAVVQDPGDLAPIGKWIDLGLGSVAPQGARSLSVTRDPVTDTLELTALTTDGQVYAAWLPDVGQTTSAAFQQITWINLTGGSSGLASAKAITAGEDGGQETEVFALGTNNHVYRLNGIPAQQAFIDSWQDLGAVMLTTGSGKKQTTTAAVLSGMGVGLLPGGALQVLAAGKNSSGGDTVWSIAPFASSVTSNSGIGSPGTLSPVEVAYSAPSESATGWSEVSSFTQIVIGHNADGSPVAFALGGPNGHTVYVNTTYSNGTWGPSNWMPLVSMSNPPAIVQIALTDGTDGEGEPYALDSNGTVYELTTARDAPGFFSWTAVEHGVPDGGAYSLRAYTNPVTGLQSLFVVSRMHGFVYQLAQQRAGDWSGGWKQIDAAWNQPQEVQGAICLVAGPNGQPLVFAVTKVQAAETIKDTVMVFAVVQDPTDLNPIGKWIDLGVGALSPQGIKSVMVTLNAGSGAMAVTALGVNGHVYQTIYAAGTTRPTSASWQQSWTDLTAGQAGLPTMTALATAQDPNGTLQVVAVGSNNHVYWLQGPALPTAEQPSGQWQDLGAALIPVVQKGRTVPKPAMLTSISLGHLPDGTLEVLVYGKNGSGQNTVWVGTQTGANGAFLPLPASLSAWQLVAM
jgi:hypothetical protein